MATLHAAATETLTSLADRRYVLLIACTILPRFLHTLALPLTSMSSSSSHLQTIMIKLYMLFAAWPLPQQALLAAMAC